MKGNMKKAILIALLAGMGLGYMLGLCQQVLQKQHNSTHEHMQTGMTR